ncbi:MAG: hypothetical protein GXP28_05980 [Planctomycetes bacterium]|nr:hypothetical protein [Planctomycetota bacterium]
MSRLKRIMKRLAIGFAILVAMLLIVNGAYSWHTGRQLEQRLAKLRAAGEPTTFAELAPKPIPPEQDAAIHLQRLAPQLKAFAKEHVDFLDRTPLGKSFSERDRGEPPTSEQIAAIREILSHYPDLPQAIDEASRCEEYASQIDYTVADCAADRCVAGHCSSSPVLDALMSSTNDRRTPGRFLRWNAIVLLTEGKQDEALKTGLVTLRLARHYDREPALVNGLIACAVRGASAHSLNLVLRSGPLSAEVRQQLDEELARHENPTRVLHVMKTERVINLSASRSLFVQAWWLPWIERGLLVDTIDYYERLLPVISQPWHESHKQIHRLNAEVSYLTNVSGALIGLLTSTIEAAREAFDRATATLRCLRILNALTAFAQANGHEAEGLDDLDLPEAAKIDPFSGKPLRLKWTDDGWVVYSVFKNGTDDDGDFKDQADWGLGPTGYPGVE